MYIVISIGVKYKWVFFFKNYTIFLTYSELIDEYIHIIPINL